MVSIPKVSIPKGKYCIDNSSTCTQLADRGYGESWCNYYCTVIVGGVLPQKYKLCLLANDALYDETKGGIINEK